MNSETLRKYAPQALAVLRIATALTFMAHGTQKLFGVPASQMPGGVELLSLFGVAGILEVFGGLAILLGLFTRPVAFILAGEMAWAFWTLHVPMGGSIIPVSNGGDGAVLFCFVFLYLVFAGPGTWALDHLRSSRTVPA